MQWGIVFLLPFSLWFAVFLAQYLRDGKFRYAFGSVIFLTLMFYQHPSTVVIVPGFVVGMLWFRHAELRRDWIKIVLTGTGILLVLFPWLMSIVRNYSPNKNASRPIMESFLGALASFHDLTSWGFSDYFGPETGLSMPGTLVLVSIPIIVFFIVCGGIITIKHLLKRQANVFDRLCFCCLGCVVFYVLLFPFFRLRPYPHYNLAVLFAWLLLAWRGFTALQCDYRRFAAGALGITLLLEICFLIDFSAQIHCNSGTSSWDFRTTLARQWEVARDLAAAHRTNPNFRVDVRVEHIRNYSLPLRVLISQAEKMKLPKCGFFSRAILLPSRVGYGLDLIFLK